MSLGGLTALRLAVTAPDLVRRLVLVDVTPSAPERHTEMTDAQKGTVALVRGDRTFPTFDAMLEVDCRRRAASRPGVVAARRVPQRQAPRRRHLDVALRLDPQGLTASRICGTTCPCVTTPTTLIRGANSFFVNDEDADAFAKARRAFSASTSSPTPATRCRATSRAALVDLLRGVLETADV